MNTQEIDFKNIGTNICKAESARKRKEKFLASKEYWEHLEQKKGNHAVVKNLLLNMQELSKEFLVVPRLLEQFFFLYLNEKHPSQQNRQLALNVARVFAVLTHQYYKSATIFNMVSSFYVSPSVWDKWLVGRKAKESGIKILKEMGVITSYRFNRNKFAPAENSRFVIMYQFNVDKVMWLHGCVKTLAVYEESKQEASYAGQQFHYDYSEITEDIFDYIGQAEC